VNGDVVSGSTTSVSVLSMRGMKNSRVVCVFRVRMMEVRDSLAIIASSLDARAAT